MYASHFLLIKDQVEICWDLKKEFTQSKEKRWANTKIIMVDFPVLFVCERNIVQGPMVTLPYL